ncbi:MAG: response regulator [Bdellovibrionales bacterium]|nr:response regulator [Bdellovibrionales bacterium]
MRGPDYNLPILLIDDDALVRDVVEQYLKSIGFNRVLAVGDPQKALRMFQDPQVPIGLVISDWEMPGTTGLTLLKALRNHPIRRHTGFIMITSQRSMERFKVTQAAQWKVNSYLMKPFRAEALRHKIWEVMNWDNIHEDSA